MTNPLIMKLEHGADLTDADRNILEAVSRQSRALGAHEEVIREGDAPTAVRLVMDGWACRYKVLPDGRRQIMAFLLPGDFCDLHVAVLGEMDHGIATLTPCDLVEIDRETVDDLTMHHPRITRALWWATLVDEGVLREWLVNMGQRHANERVAHVICELYFRLQTVGRTIGNAFDFPLTQVEFADVLGLSIVHINRTVQHLRAKGLIVLHRRRLIIPDIDRLVEFAEFNSNYLHLRSERRQLA